MGEVASLFHSWTVVITGKHPASGNLFSRNFPLVLVLYTMGNILISLTLYFVLCKRRWALDSVLVRSRLVHERQDPPPPRPSPQEWLKLNPGSGGGSTGKVRGAALSRPFEPSLLAHFYSASPKVYAPTPWVKMALWSSHP